MAALSQLSYGPLVPSQCNRELEILRPRDTETLVIPCRRYAQANLSSRVESLDRKVIALIVFWAVRGVAVNFIDAVTPPPEAGSIPPIRVAPHDHHVAI
jgi:hypothetical protein